MWSVEVISHSSTGVPSSVTDVDVTNRLRTTRRPLALGVLRLHYCGIFALHYISSIVALARECLPPRGRESALSAAQGPRSCTTCRALLVPFLPPGWRCPNVFASVAAAAAARPPLLPCSATLDGAAISWTPSPCATLAVLLHPPPWRSEATTSPLRVPARVRSPSMHGCAIIAAMMAPTVRLGHTKYGCLLTSHLHCSNTCRPL